jgi:transposase
LKLYDDHNYIGVLSIDRQYLLKEQYDDDEKRYVANFPESVARPIQYGSLIKAHAVYLFQFQLMPYQRIQD